MAAPVAQPAIRPAFLRSLGGQREHCAFKAPLVANCGRGRTRRTALRQRDGGQQRERAIRDRHLARGHSGGFGTQYCAYHSSTSSTFGNVAYTNLPYITDAGVSCGANFNGLGPNAGITIVGGHEMAETMTDQFPNGGWLDSSGAENGDKCAWISSGQGAAADITLSTGTFPVQSLWSNGFNSGSGGCVLSYP